jgi:hypothetical protein
MREEFLPTKVGLSKNTTFVGSAGTLESGLKNFSDMNLYGIEVRMDGNVYGNDTKPAI